MTLSLDSSVAIDLIRGRRRPVRDRFDAARRSGEEIVLSAVVLFELAAGLRKSLRPDTQARALDDFLSDIPVMDLDASDAMEAGGVRAELETPGVPIGTGDVLIAGQARNRGWTIVTSDVAHFGRVQGLTLIDWRVSDRPFSYLDILAHLRRTPKDK